MGHKLLATFLLTLAFPALAFADSVTYRKEAALQALFTVGVPYHYGGNSPETGFDCSGLVSHVFERAWGLEVPRGTEAQRAFGKPVKRLRDLQPGDLVFYDTRNRPYSHVGIYLGDGNFVHAPRPGQRVRIESVNNPYWRSRFNGARRIDPPRYSLGDLRASAR